MKKILTAFAILVPYAINGIVITFVNPVYPLLAESRQTPSIVQGLFFSLFVVPQFLVFMYAPSIERKLGVKTTFFIHILINAVSVLLLGALQFIESPVLFSIWSIFFRTLNGIGDAGITYQYRPLAK